MNRRAFLTGLSALVAASPALADAPAVERIKRELRALGYSRISVERTLLGRARIVADSFDASREIIVNPVTGEILRDLWMPHVSGNSGTGGLLNASSGTDDADDDADDDDGDDDDDDGKDGDDDDEDGGKGRGRGRGGDDD